MLMVMSGDGVVRRAFGAVRLCERASILLLEKLAFRFHLNVMAKGWGVYGGWARRACIMSDYRRTKR